MLDSDRITSKALRLLLVFLSILAVAAFGLSLHRLGGSLTLSYLPNGVAVAATYRFGRRVWPALLVSGPTRRSARLIGGLGDCILGIRAASAAGRMYRRGNRSCERRLGFGV